MANVVSNQKPSASASCLLCDDPGNSLMLLCSGCDVTCHYKCADTSEEKDRPWRCKRCRCPDDRQSRRSRSNAASHTSTHNSNRSANRIELQRLEEHRQLVEEMNKEREKRAERAERLRQEARKHRQEQEERQAIQRAERARAREERMIREQEREDREEADRFELARAQDEQENRLWEERELEREQTRSAEIQAYINAKYDIIARRTESSTGRSHASIQSWVDDVNNQTDQIQRNHVYVNAISGNSRPNSPISEASIKNNMQPILPIPTNNNTTSQAVTKDHQISNHSRQMNPNQPNDAIFVKTSNVRRQQMYSAVEPDFSQEVVSNIDLVPHYRQPATQVTNPRKPQVSYAKASEFNCDTQGEFHYPLYTTTVPGFGAHVKRIHPHAIESAVQTVNHSQEMSPLHPRQIATRQALPKDLPIFSGRPEEWPIFISQFESSTELCGYSNCENLIRLQRALRGKALETVECELVLPEEVPAIIDTLRRRFGNPEIIIFNLLSKIRNHPGLKADKLDALIDFAQLVKNICTTMKTSQLQEGHLMNPILLRELCEKLPAQQRLLWGMFVESHAGIITLVTFSNWLQQLARAAGHVATLHIPAPEMKSSKNGAKGVHAHSNVSNVSIQQHNQVQSSRSKSNEQENQKPAKEDQTSEQVMKKSTQCPCCKSTSSNIHSLEKCPEFAKKNRTAKWTIIKDHRLCYKCFQDHSSNRCPSTKLCGVDGCERMHHSLLHNTNQNNSQANAKPDVCNIHNTATPEILYRIVPVRLHSDATFVDTFAFLDEGSSITLMDQSLANDLHLNGIPDKLCLRWTAETTRMEENSRRVNVRISAKSDNAKLYELQNVRTVDKLCLPRQSVDYDATIAKFPYLKGVPFESYTNAEPKLMIGLDSYKVAVPLKTREGNWKQPTATKTRLGWIVHGPINNRQESANFTEIAHHNFHACNCASFDRTIEDQVRNYFLLDSFGVDKPAQALESNEERRARILLETSTIRDERGFTSGLLWRFDSISLPDSLPMAKRRLACLEKKMTKDPKLGQMLRDEMIKYQQSGYIRKLTPAEINKVSPRTWYLPVFTVTNANKPGKFRMVWDAAATVKDVSLNTMLLKGPDLLSNLTGVLIRFRERRVAICGDIRQMYHQVRINKDDQDSQRFLWRTDKKASEPDVYVMNVMTFGATCSPSTAQYVMNVNASEFSKEFPRAVIAIQENHYVDDWLDSMDTISETVRLAKEVKRIHERGGFQIRNWLSNSKEVVAALESPSSMDGRSLELGSDTEQSKVLGMWWCTKTDTFTFSLKHAKADQDILNGSRVPTKREVLRIVMSIYDPLGLIAHFLVYVKILLQDIWRSNIGWDDELKNEELHKWFTWLHVLPQVENVHIQRCIRQTSCRIKSIQLHTFVDASEHAFAAVCYIRIATDAGIECSILMSKTRVAPQKPMSIPRLELQAATLGVRLAKNLREMHNLIITESIYWTDSRNVLCWIRSDARKFRQFVAFRISEILDTTEVNQWRWIPSKMNVADEATKWTKTPKMDSTASWFAGPEFLRQSPNNWPVEQETIDSNTCDNEIRPNLYHTVVPNTTIWDFDRFSNWTRLIRSQAYVYRFLHNLQCSIDKKKDNRLVGHIDQGELHRAEQSLIRQVQYEAYTEEVQQFQKLRTYQVKATSTLFKKSPYMDEDNILRMHGRIDNATCEFAMKRPILLPHKHKVTRLIADYYHRLYHHHNHRTAINEFVQKFSVSSACTLMNVVRRSCQRCKNNSALPRIPEMGDLPAARLASNCRPFTYTGVDFFGPIIVTVGRRNEKRWGAIFTCLTIRAVHIELAYSLSTDSFILCFRNFVARRGSPREIYCDNGTNFRGAESELRAEFQKIDQSKLQERVTTAITKWNFIPPTASHMGGSWERLVRSSKTTLYSILKTVKPSEELLRGLLSEVEMTINSRPLTNIPISEANEEALTPNHFLLGSSSGEKPIADISFDEKTLRRNWKSSQQLAEHFWRRWIREYLPTLTRRTKWFQKVKPLEVGDIVVIVDADNPRNTWPKAIIRSTHIGSNGQVRHAVVQTSSGIYTRPASKLALLDLCPESAIE